MGGNDRIYRIDCRFFYYCSGFDTHWTHVSIPPDGAVRFIKLFENSGRGAARVCSQNVLVLTRSQARINSSRSLMGNLTDDAGDTRSIKP
jgi:hypothetical protein